MLNYNGLKYLKKTVAGILRLDYPNYEFIVVDNGSTDESIDFIKKFKKIRIIKNGENLGYSKGKNIGVKKAKGKYVLLLDEDILVEHEALLKNLIELLKKKGDILNISLLLCDEHEEYTDYYGGFYSLYGLAYKKRVRALNIMNNSKELVEIASPDGGALFFRKKTFEKIGGYDESQPYYCDVGDYGIRGVILTGKKNYLYTKECLIHLGKERKVDNRAWCWKYKYVFSGLSKIIIKNYNKKKVLTIDPLFLFFMLIKTIKQTVFRKDLRVISSLLFSVYFFLKDLPDTLKQRRVIQSKRVLKNDVFLKIKIPKFD